MNNNLFLKYFPREKIREEKNLEKLEEKKHEKTKHNVKKVKNLPQETYFTPERIERSIVQLICFSCNARIHPKACLHEQFCHPTVSSKINPDTIRSAYSTREQIEAFIFIRNE